MPRRPEAEGERKEGKRDPEAGKRKGRRHERKIPVAMRSGETPVPIPNTMVKTWAADGTMLGTAWESRWLPDH